ncbi:MAG: Molybdenum ABC transporter, periplasmic molybdenum-binding protein ModA [uncultured Solirubrobacteraceae bacterium]|uniref:Molybdenum ABC transporter, periplasmic molybdenum-binding protein ModA n=1 Tax=uncultured Solirubrobacteraceae bacterium TaxID=1162706 RepID=A0A6J4SVS5_9ACTN|nr:MAG: Molybdenum ABC transporter, periplasmic molybdenum-binding protein ModA [uncultured Solirubrobacteraceae bacterium]
MTRPGRPGIALAALVVALLAGAPSACGGDAENGAGRRPKSGEVVVAAAASLKQALTRYGERFDGGVVRLSFAGSDELAAQIRQGVTPDVFAAANVTLPDQLFEEGLVERPVRFATNELVLAVPAAGGKVASLADLGRDGVTLALGADGVPVGEYTRAVLDRLPATRSEAILANVRSREPDVGGIVGKLTQGAVDAGFVYRSDVAGARGKLRAIELPDALKPTVEYGVTVVRGAPNRAGGRAFVDGLLAGAGAQALRDHGFGPPAGT